MDAATSDKILASGGLEVAWPNEPLLGGYYGEEEMEVLNRTVRESFDPTKGFGFICPEIEQFEAALAEYSCNGNQVFNEKPTSGRFTGARSQNAR